MVPRQAEVMTSLASESLAGPSTPAVDKELKHTRNQILPNAYEAVQAASESTRDSVQGTQLAHSMRNDPRKTPVAAADDRTTEAAAGESLNSAVAGVIGGPDEDVGTASEKVSRRLCQRWSINLVLIVAV